MSYNCIVQGHHMKYNIGKKALTMKNSTYQISIPINLRTSINWIFTEGQMNGFHIGGIMVFSEPETIKTLKSDLSNKVIFENIDAHYKFDAQLGVGAYSTVFRAYSREGDMVAIKKIDRALISTSCVLREISTLSILNHKNIVQLIEVYADDNFYYLVMEYLTPLVIEDNEKDLKRIMVSLLSALEYLHQLKIIHRDISSRNLMVNFQGDPKIIDFGLAVNCHENFFKVGTPGYIAPEVFRGIQDSKSDIFSFGSAIYELYTKRTLIHTGTKQQMIHFNQMYSIRKAQFNGFSEELTKIFQAILDPNPQKRLSAEQVLEHSFCDQDSWREISISSMSPKFFKKGKQNSGIL